MSALLVLLVLAGAAWLALTTAGGRTGRGPVDSVTEFSRAMSALDPAAPPRQPAPRR